MKSLKKNLVLLLLVSLAVISSCENKKEKKHKKKDKEEQKDKDKKEQNDKASAEMQSVKDDDTSIDCDKSIWKYVYNPERLQIIDTCKTVTGIIEESSANDDGDQHMLLKLDKGQENLLMKNNIKKKQGDLVIEAVCANKATSNKVGNICNGYINKIQLPKIGDHVAVTGSYVNDTHNGWAEIHPITKIKILK